MQPLQRPTWTFPEQCSSSDLQTILARSFTLHSSASRTFKRCWFDTFDWRLFHRKQLLVREGNKWILRNFLGTPLHTLNSHDKDHLFQQQFPDSALRDALRKSLGIRALIQQGHEDIQASEIKLLNTDQKIVAIIELQESRLPGRKHAQTTAYLHEIRGYRRSLNTVTNIFLDMGGKEEDGPQAGLKRVLRNNDRAPLDYSSGYSVALDPTMTGAEAVSHIYLSLLTDIRRNEQGISDDIDTEFLHDLRVAVRRTRSGLTLIKGILLQKHTAHFKKEFRLIGKMTGAVRDLDVYLLNEKNYRALLPQRLQGGLQLFFQDLAARRAEEQEKLRHFLQSSHYRQTLNNWEKLFTSNTPFPGGKNSQAPVPALARKIILKHFHKVLHDGRKIQPETADSELHKLRIQCKKLRYSLEFFSSLYEKKQIKQLVGQLKKLQNNLGDFNDLSVQQEMLAVYLTGLRPGRKNSREMAASIGGLMTDLARQHHDVRAHFAETFARFSRKKTLDLYTTLFSKA